MRKPRLRDGKNRKSSELYPLAEFPSSVIYEVGRWIVYQYTTGKTDISGEDWGDIFASAINGEHLSSPIGLADVVYSGQAWSVKSVKHTNPHNVKTIRIISGRNSPDYSYGIADPRADIQETGNAVLGIWNERVKIAIDQYGDLRASVLIRNSQKLTFTLFETQTSQYVPSEYRWEENKRGNFEGYSRRDGSHKFTWQPHGSQFTIKYPVPSSAVKFTLKRPPTLDFESTLKQIGYSDDWVTIE